LRAILDEEVHRLPERLRAPIVLCYLENQTVDEAALQLGCPRGTVASRLARARARLHRRLSGRGLGGNVLMAGLPGAAAGTSAPGRLLGSALQIVKLNGAAKGAAAGLPGGIVALTEEVLRAMQIKKTALVMAALLISAGVFFVGGAVAMNVIDFGPAPAQPPGKAAGLQNQVVVPPSTPQAKEQQPVARPKVAQPVVEPDPQSFTGAFEASQIVDVVPGVNGRIAAIHCQVGASVKKGDLLLELENAAFKESVDRSQVSLQLAEAKRRASEAEARRWRAIVEAKTAEASMLADAELKLAVAEAAIKQAQLDLVRARRELDATQVRAPADGVLGKMLVNLGGAVSTEKAVTTVMQLDPMHFVFSMDERSFLALQQERRDNKLLKNSPISIAPLRGDGPGQKGTISSVNDRFDPKTGTIHVTATLPNASRLLLPGMFGEVQMEVGKTKLLLPYKAIHDLGKDPYVLLINDANMVERRSVKLLGVHYPKALPKAPPDDDDPNASFVEAGTLIEIRSGLNPTDWVVIEGGATLRPGDRVDPVRVNEQPSSKSPKK
jgi:RND family efflux transporter MFP subunit